ncbi:MAG: 50S ribosomal protein L11 methyltransferase [Armatimonadota bacterium]|nr:50S ribosomal protein L11 methyltransferase [Armatimonadota bacterium]MDR5676407.1 50S ribosomal protein L11 methyltransferase [Armatimonadota bacterium]MDR5689316.1 50S ribosomal protein L11 methyltransferase [Armatimonadota bacterium]MDR7414144.1 50S ribosomal protein L11 methyltransferase [Armatimonadota bacterium]MDR7429394.1 50S ribosomal protein L11 methyltransferase [Armatimonadota bacterium]
MRPGKASSSWLEVSVVTSPEAAEVAAAQLVELVPGWAEERGDGGVRLVAWLPDDPVSRRCVEALLGRIRQVAAWGLDPGACQVRVRTIPGQPWETAWRRHFQPFRVGRFLVRPPWAHHRRGGGALVLVLNPGMAFGTGLHESTRLCLRVLPDLVRRGARVLDVGTGSGILAIAAAKLGARVLAVDCDRLACQIARANARANRVSDRVVVRCGDLFGPVRGRADVVLMNITAEVLLRAVPLVGRHLRPGGAWVVSGMVAGNAKSVLEAAAAHGLRVERLLRDGEWRAAVLRAAGGQNRAAPSG